MIAVSTFLDKVKEIAARPLTYRTGGSGKDGTCDCIGLIIGAMQELEHAKYDMHSTNYFARYQMESVAPVDSNDLAAGYIVYKARANTQQLHERYQPGGRYYTGDMLDYYHVGVVESTDPLVIVHCTESGDVNGITRDFRIGSWSRAGRLKGVSYETKEETEVEPMMGKAIVIAQSGHDVNMRKSPSIKSQLMMRVPIGAGVNVIENGQNDAGEDWSRIEYGGYTGYMMSQYLKRSADDEEAEEQPSGTADEVTVTIPKNAAEAILRALVEVLGT